MKLAAETYCDQCGRTDEDIGSCGRSVTRCPDPTPLDPAKVAIISYERGTKTVAIPVSRLLRGKLGDFARVITVDDPSAKLLFPEEPVSASDPELEAALRDVAQLSGQVREAREAARFEASRVDDLAAQLRTSEEQREKIAGELEKALTEKALAPSKPPKK